MELINGDLKKIFRRYLATSLGSAVVVSIYSTVDMVCVGHYCGPDGSAAISCVNPLWAIMLSLGMLFGVGGAILMTNLRGAGNTEGADGYFTVAITASSIASVLVMLLFLFWREPLLRFFGANDALLPYAMAYSQWLAWAVPAFLLGSTVSAFIRNDGAPGLCTAAILIGGGLNVAGDIYFVFDFGFGMGMSGAGLATAIGQVVAFLIICSYFLQKRCQLRLRKCGQFFSKLGTIFLTGFAPSIVDLAFGVTVVLFNRQIMRLAGAGELAVFGTVATVAVLFQSLFNGVGQAIQPVVSTNFGAGKTDRVLKMRRIAMLTTVGMGVGLFALSEIFPDSILKIYMAVTQEILDIGVPAMRIYAVAFLLMGINIVATYYLGSVLRSRQSLIISMSRGLILPGGFALLLPALFGFSAIWWAIPAAEGITALYAAYVLYKKGQAPAVEE